MSIYLGVSPDNIDRIAPVYSLFLQQLVDLNTRDLPDAASNVPVLILLDEFARLGKASVIAAGFSYFAGSAFRLLPVTQGRAHLRALFGPDFPYQIFPNSALGVVFTAKGRRAGTIIRDGPGFFTLYGKRRTKN